MTMQGGSAYCMASMTSGTCTRHMPSSLAGGCSWFTSEPRPKQIETKVTQPTDQGKPPGDVRLQPHVLRREHWLLLDQRRTAQIKHLTANLTRRQQFELQKGRPL